jgi:ABC-type sugar transport system permease subunit
MISSLFLVNWIYTIIDFCMRSDNEVMEKISDQMITQINYGFASAMSWIYFAIVIVIIAVSSFIISKGVYYYD